MSKIVLNDVTNLNTLSVINDNFDKIEQEFQNKALYRDNPEGEPNTLENDVDVNGNNIYNVNNLTVSNSFTVNGKNIEQVVDDAIEGVQQSATAAANSATAAATSAANALSSAGNAAASATSAASSATLATSKASEASTSASNAATSATNASTSASAAANSATSANTYAGQASGSAAAAAASATSAATSASNASTSATSASASATSASTSATNAAASATLAQGYAASINPTTFVSRTSATGSAIMPAGTTAQRDGTPVFGYSRANSTLNKMEWWNGTSWTPMGGGATGGGADEVFVENSQIVSANYTITSGKNAMSTGPITVNNGITVTVPSGSVWVVI